MKEINGKIYPLWSQFEDRKEEWIGGILEDFGDNFDRRLGLKGLPTTEIVNIELKPNGEKSAWFGVEGKDFDCGFDVQVGGIIKGDEDWITFQGYGGHIWRIKQKQK